MAEHGIRYIGARYVPKFADPIEWNSSTIYEPLTIVTHNGASYTSKQSVPTGIDIANDEYWALTGNYNAQVQHYIDTVQTFDPRIATNQADIVTIQEDITELESQLGTANDAIAANASDIDQLQTDVATVNDTTIPAIEDEIAANASDIDQLQTDVATINDTTIPAIEDEIDNVVEYVDDAVPIKIANVSPYCAPSYIGHFIENFQVGCACHGANDKYYIFTCNNWNNGGRIHFADLKANTISNESLATGHANSCAYDPVNNIIWLAPLRNYAQGDGTYSSDSTLKRIALTSDGVNIAGVTSVGVPESMLSVSYDHVTNTLYAFGANITNNKRNVYKYNGTTFELIGEIERPSYLTLITNVDSGSRILPQDIAVYDSYAFQTYTDGTTFVNKLDFTEDSVSHVINSFVIGSDDANGNWRFGEQQGIEFDRNGIMIGVRDCLTSVSEPIESDATASKVRIGVVTANAVFGQAYNAMAAWFDAYDSVDCREEYQSRFSLTSSQIKSVNELNFRKHRPKQVSIYGSCKELHRVSVVDDLNLVIQPNATYQIGYIEHRSGKLQIFIFADGVLRVNRVANENFINATARNTDLAISNRGTINIVNSGVKFYDFGYQATTLAVTQFGTVTRAFLFGDLTITGKGFWICNHAVTSWT